MQKSFMPHSKHENYSENIRYLLSAAVEGWGGWGDLGYLIDLFKPTLKYLTD